MAVKKQPARGKAKTTRAAKAKRAPARAKRIVESNAAPAADEAIAAPPPSAEGAAAQKPAAQQQQQQQQQQTTISTSRGFADFLATNRLSLALTSYQTGQLMLIGALLDGQLSVFQRNFVRAMGLWATPQRLFLATIAQIWRLENVLGPGQLATQQKIHYERLYVPRMSHTTGDVDAHELAVDGKDRLVFVNTKYSCLATAHTVHSFKPVWKPKFISKLAPEDRCHLNGLAMQNGAPKYVTAVSRFDVIRRLARAAARRRHPHRRGDRPRVSPRICRCRTRRGSMAVSSGCSIRGAAILAASIPRPANGSRWPSARDSPAGCRSGAATRWWGPRCRATAPSRGWSSRTTPRRRKASRAAAPIIIDTRNGDIVQ